jgi:hypothetical protein
MTPVRAPGPFRYLPYEIDADASQLTCRYELGPHRFEEQFTFEGETDWGAAGVETGARLVALLAGISYYKTGAPVGVDLGDLATTAAERTLLAASLRHGLGEFAFRNGLDLSDVAITGPELAPVDGSAGGGAAGSRPLVPFGGGIDSIVTVESVRSAQPDTTLLVVSRPGDRFEAIEAPAAVTGLPVRRVGRAIDTQLLDSAA